MSMLVPAMPVAGFSGTLAPRYTSDETESGARRRPREDRIARHA